MASCWKNSLLDPHLKYSQSSKLFGLVHCWWRGHPPFSFRSQIPNLPSTHSGMLVLGSGPDPSLSWENLKFCLCLRLNSLKLAGILVYGVLFNLYSNLISFPSIPVSIAQSSRNLWKPKVVSVQFYYRSLSWSKKTLWLGPISICALFLLRSRGVLPKERVLYQGHSTHTRYKSCRLTRTPFHEPPQAFSSKMNWIHIEPKKEKSWLEWNLPHFVLL